MSQLAYLTPSEADIPTRDHFKLITDHYYDRLFVRLPTTANAVILSVIAGATPFFLGWTVAVLIDFQDVYLTSRPVYMGSFVVGWVLFALRVGSLWYHVALAAVRPCVLMETTEWFDFVRRWLGRLGDRSGAVWCSAVLFAIGLAHAAIAFFWPDPGLFQLLPTFRPSLFPPEWYYGQAAIGKFLIIDLYLIFGAIPCGTALWSMTLNLAFVWRLAGKRMVPLPGALVRGFSGVISLHEFAGTTWFIGLSFVIYLYLHNLDPWSISWLGLGVVIGTAYFILPHYAVYQSIKRAEKGLSENAIDTYRNYLMDGQAERDADQVQRMILLSTILQATQPGVTRAFGARSVVIWLLGQLLALAGMLLKLGLVPSLFLRLGP